MKKQGKRIVLLALFIAMIALARYSPLGAALTFENLKQHRDTLLAFVQERYWLSVASFITVYIVAISLSLPAGLVLTLAGGFLFGTPAGVLYINIGATTGAIVSFLSARYLLGTRLQETYALPLMKFNNEIERNGSRYLLTARLIPVFPFFLVNFLAGLTRVPLRTFIWTTSLGIIPASVIFAFAGRQLGTLDSPSDIISKKMLLALAALALLTLFPVIRKRRERAREGPDK